MRIDRQRFAWRRLGDTVVVLDLELAEYFSLGGVAGELWRRLEQGDDRTELITFLGASYDVDPSTASTDVDQFLADLTARSVFAST